MARYSLKELLYWLTLWTLGMSALTAAFRPPPPEMLIVATAWFGGALLLRKAVSRLASLAFAVAIGFIWWTVAGTPVSSSKLSAEDYVRALSLAVMSGIFVCNVVAVADELCNRFIRPRAGDA